jgi:hypothetical protein
MGIHLILTLRHAFRVSYDNICLYILINKLSVMYWSLLTQLNWTTHYNDIPPWDTDKLDTGIPTRDIWHCNIFRIFFFKNDCQPDTCKNKGTCYPNYVDNSHTCECPCPYQGRNCEKGMYWFISHCDNLKNDIHSFISRNQHGIKLICIIYNVYVF